jgi:hypothetical protein
MSTTHPSLDDNPEYDFQLPAGDHILVTDELCAARHFRDLVDDYGETLLVDAHEDGYWSCRLYNVWATDRPGRLYRAVNVKYGYRWSFGRAEALTDDDGAVIVPTVGFESVYPDLGFTRVPAGGGLPACSGITPGDLAAAADFARAWTSIVERERQSGAAARWSDPG